MSRNTTYTVFRHMRRGTTWTYVYSKIFAGIRFPMSEWQMARAAEVASATLQARVRAMFDARAGLDEAELDISRVVRESATRARTARRAVHRSKHEPVSYHERSLRAAASRKARTEARRKHIVALRAAGIASDPLERASRDARESAEQTE